MVIVVAFCCCCCVVDQVKRATVNKIRAKLRASAYDSTRGEDLQSQFRRIDADGSGTLSADEFKRVVRETAAARGGGAWIVVRRLAL